MNVRLLIATHIGMQFHCESQSVIYGNMPISVINIKIIEKNQDDPDLSTQGNSYMLHIYHILYQTCWVSGPVQVLLASSIHDNSSYIIYILHMP